MKGTNKNLNRIRKGKVRIIFILFKNYIIIMRVEDIGYRRNFLTNIKIK